MNQRSRRLLAFCLTLWPVLARADVVWPALYLETRLLSWWSILAGLLVEWVFVRWLFSAPIKRAAIATLMANTASTLLGVLLIPVAGIAWEFFPGIVFWNALNWGTFNPVTWIATFLLACGINTYIECTVYRRIFSFVVRRREYGWIFVANAASVCLAYGSLFVKPVEP